MVLNIDFSSNIQYAHAAYLFRLAIYYNYNVRRFNYNGHKIQVAELKERKSKGKDSSKLEMDRQMSDLP